MLWLFFSFLFAQANGDVRSVWDIALQFGMAGAVLVVVYLFLLYLKRRDEQDERRDGALADANRLVAEKLHELAVSIARLPAAERRRTPQTNLRPGDAANE